MDTRPPLEYGSGSGNQHKFHLGGEEPNFSIGVVGDTDMTEDEWEQPDQTTLIPDLCYCEPCKTLFYSRTDIFQHLLSDYESDECTNRRIPYKRITELGKCCNLKEFLNWLLSLVLNKEDPKYFSDEIFKGICDSTLLGAPESRSGNFMMWVLTQTWCANAQSERAFLHSLFDPPKAVINWDWFWECHPLSRSDSAYVSAGYVPPTICVYSNVDSKEVTHVPVSGRKDLFSSPLDEDSVDEKTSSSVKGMKVEQPHHDIFYSICGKPILGVPIFELYSISINKVDPGHEDLWIYICYIPDDGLETYIFGHRFDFKEVGKHLILFFETPPAININNVLIYVSYSEDQEDREDCWRYDLSKSTKENMDTVITHKYQAENDVLATIVYRASQCAVRAKLTFTLVEEKGRDVYIARGSITATDGDDDCTRRIITKYDEEGQECLISGMVLEVHRSEFGVPMSVVFLRVDVELEYCCEKDMSDEKKKIKGSLKFPIPEVFSSQGHILRSDDDSSGTFLCVETSWTSSGSADDVKFRFCDQ